MPQKDLSFSVLGSGSWGTALAALLADNGHRTVLWGRNAEQINSLSKTRINEAFFPDIRLPEALQFSSQLKTCLSADSIPLIVVPSSGFRGILQQIAPELRKIGKIVWATKGLEEGSQLLMHQVVEQTLGEQMQMAVISGPNFASEVARKIPSATTVASQNPAFADTVAAALHNAWFRPYTASDIIGVQLGGALKNVLAIASGISDGLGFGANTRAALLTRGLAEITRLAMQLGAQQETLTGLAGIGDLMLTCTDNQSRNRRFGIALASGKTVKEALAGIGQVVEGAQTAQAAQTLALQENVEMPIVEQVYRVIFKGVSANEAVKSLLMRQTRQEL